MTHKFHTTNNATWRAKKPPVGKAGSERMVLYTMIASHPGISSGELESKWPFCSSMRSRLKELYDKNYIELSHQADLFGDSQPPQ